MKRSWLCLLSLLSISIGAAVSAEAQRNTDSAMLIAAIEQRVGLRQRTVGEFTQDKHIAVLPQPLQSRGEFTYDPQSGLVWNTLTPIANKVIFDQQGIRQSMEGETVWQIDARQPAVTTITQVISSVLAADWKALEVYFDIAGSINEQGWKLHLQPRDEVLAQIVDAIELQGDRELSRMLLNEANGDRTEIRFQMHDPAQP